MGPFHPWFWIGLVATGASLLQAPLDAYCFNFLWRLTLLGSFWLACPSCWSGLDLPGGYLRSRNQGLLQALQVLQPSPLGQCSSLWRASLVSAIRFREDGSVTWENRFALSSPQPFWRCLSDSVSNFGVASNRDDQASEFCKTSDPSSEN